MKPVNCSVCDHRPFLRKELCNGHLMYYYQCNKCGEMANNPRAISFKAALDEWNESQLEGVY